MPINQSYPSAYWQQFFDEDGNPLSNGTIKTFYASDHSLPIQTYTYPNSGVKNPTSIMLDSAGRCTFALETNIAYYIEVYDSDNNLKGTFDNVTAGGGGGGGMGDGYIDDTLHGDGTFENPLGVSIPRVINGLVRNIVGETDNVHTRVRQYLSDGSTIIGLSVDETEYTSGFGINIDGKVISLDTEANLDIDYLTGRASAVISVDDLNSNITESKSRGNKVYVENNSIKLKPGTYAVNAFVKINNSGLTLNSNIYKVSIYGGFDTDVPTKVVEFDNSFAHEEIYEVTYLTINKTEDTDLPLVLTTDAHTQFNANTSLDYIQVYNLNGMIGEGGGNVRITSEDESVDITETIAHGYKTFDLSVQALPDISEGDEGKVLTVDSEGNPEWAEHQQVQSDWNQSDTSAVDYIKNKPVLATVAHTGDYEDLTNKPTINNVPPVSSSDDEKVLTASYEGGVGSYSWQDAPISLPESTSADAGKVLTVDSNGDAAWQDSQGLVYVTYGTTPYSTVNSLADAGRVVYCVVNASRMAFLAYRLSNFIEFQYYRSNPSGMDSVFVYTVSRTGWTTEERKVEKTQSDWYATNTSSAAYIKNKPDLSIYATNTALNNGLAIKQDTISDLSTIRSGAAAGATAVQPGDLATIATTGSWNDLVNVPSDLVQDASYVHTDNNYTNADKSKLVGIEAGAEVNVQADWNQTTTTADDYIKNKPVDLVQDANYVHTDNNFTTAEKTKLNGIAAGAEVNVQSDWTQNDSSADDYIKHKPALYGLISGTGINIELNESEQVVISANNDPQVQSNWTETNTTSKAYIQNKPVLARVATTGSYNDLINKPTLNSVPNVASSDNGKVLTAEYSGGVGSYSWQVAPISLPPSTSSDEGKSLVVDSNGDPEWAIIQSDWSQSDNTANDYIKNKPTNMPLKAGNRISFAYVDDQLEISAAAASQVQSDWNQSNSSAVDYIKNKPSIPVIGTITL